MARARARIDVAGPRVAEAEALWHDPARWPAWIDGFARVVSLDPSWPAAGATLVWDSTPGGRGRVTERVVSHEPGSGQELAVSDGQIEGTQRIAFAELADGVELSLELSYSLRAGGPLGRVVDVLFIRRAFADSLRRTLAGFAAELRARG